MVNLIGVKMIEYLKAIGIFAGIVLTFYLGGLKAKNKKLEEDLDQEKEQSNNLQEIIKSTRQAKEDEQKINDTPVDELRKQLYEEATINSTKL
jgi:hypothetical protein